MRVVLADDSVLFREGLAALLTDAGFEVVGQLGDASSLIDRVRADPPDIVVVDIRMPPTFTSEGLVAALQIREELPAVGVLVLSQHVETHYAVKLVEGSSGGVGYLLKDRIGEVSELTEAITRIATRGSVIDPTVVARLVGRRRPNDPLAALTEREKEVLALMAEGCSNQAICQRLFLSGKTVQTHVRSIFNKLNLAPTEDSHRRVLAVLTHLRS